MICRDDTLEAGLKTLASVDQEGKQRSSNRVNELRDVVLDKEIKRNRGENKQADATQQDK